MKEKFYNKIMINGEIDSQTYQTVLNTCINILETGNTDDILVIINSNGGVVEDTNAIIDLLDIMPNRKTTVIVGRAESSAGILFLHGDRRLITKSSRFQFHMPSLQIQNACVNENDLNKLLDSLKRSSEAIKNSLLKYTRVPEDLINIGIHTSCGITFNADECVKYGIAERVLKDLEK